MSYRRLTPVGAIGTLLHFPRVLLGIALPQVPSSDTKGMTLLRPPHHQSLLDLLLRVVIRSMMSRTTLRGAKLMVFLILHPPTEDPSRGAPMRRDTIVLLGLQALGTHTYSPATFTSAVSLPCWWCHDTESSTHSSLSTIVFFVLTLPPRFYENPPRRDCSVQPLLSLTITSVTQHDTRYVLRYVYEKRGASPTLLPTPTFRFLFGKPNEIYDIISTASTKAGTPSGFAPVGMGSLVRYADRNYPDCKPYD